MINILRGAKALHENFLKCCKIPTMDFQELINVPETRSLGSYLLGEGESISAVASSLSETIKKYKKNFEKVKHFGFYTDLLFMRI